MHLGDHEPSLALLSFSTTASVSVIHGKLKMGDNRRIFSEGHVSVLRSLPSSFLSHKANLLSPRQLLELNASILQYLKPILKSEPEIYSILESRLTNHGPHGANDEQITKSIEIPENYLQKKWTTVLRLQRNIQELEMKNKALEGRNKEIVEMLDNEVKANPHCSISKINWIPSFLKSSLRFHTSPITAIAIHSFNPYIVTASQDGMMVIWNLLDLSEPVNQLKNAHSKSINMVTFQKGTSYLISCSSDQFIKVWDLSTPDDVRIPIKSLTGHEHIVSAISSSHKDPNILFSCSRDKTIKVWDLQTGWALRTIDAHSDWVRSIDSSGDYLISCSSDTSIRLTHWPTGTGVGLCLGHKQVVEDVKFIPKNSNEYLDAFLAKTGNKGTLSSEQKTEYSQVGYKYAVSCGRDKLIKIWKLPLPDYNTLNGSPMANSLNPYGECIKEIKGHASWVRCLQIHYNGRYLISSSDDQTIKIWDLSKLDEEEVKPVKSLQGHQSFVNTIAISSPTDDGELSDDKIRCYLVSGGADNVVNVWA